MKEIGTVTKQVGNKFSIKLGTLESCSCCVNEDCKTNGNELLALDPFGLKPLVGERVCVEMSASKTAKVSFIALSPSVILFIALFSISAYLQYSELVNIIAGFVGLGLGLGISYLLSKFLANELPVISAKVPVDVYPVEEGEGPDTAGPNALH